MIIFQLLSEFIFKGLGLNDTPIPSSTLFDYITLRSSNPLSNNIEFVMTTIFFIRIIMNWMLQFYWITKHRSRGLYISSGDSAYVSHWKLIVSEIGYFEINKGNGITTANVTKCKFKDFRNKSNRLILPIRFYIPFLNYGIIGLTELNDNDIMLYFKYLSLRCDIYNSRDNIDHMNYQVELNSLRERLSNNLFQNEIEFDYNIFNKSCQEISLAVGNRIGFVNIDGPDFKSFIRLGLCGLMHYYVIKLFY